MLTLKRPREQDKDELKITPPAKRQAGDDSDELKSIKWDDPDFPFFDFDAYLRENFGDSLNPEQIVTDDVINNEVPNQPVEHFSLQTAILKKSWFTVLSLIEVGEKITNGDVSLAIQNKCPWMIVSAFKKAGFSLPAIEKPDLVEFNSLMSDEYIDYCFKNFGRIGYEEGLLAITSLNHNKPDTSKITVLNEGIDEFYQYLICILQAKSPLEEIFIISYFHWKSGMIKIDQNNFIHILLNDPMGHVWASTEVSTIKMVLTHYNYKIYVSEENRQKVSPGCSIIALDDARSLLKVQKYLPASYSTKGFFAYLNDHAAYQENEAIYLVSLPLYLMRTMRSRDLKNKVIPSKSIDEQESPINKKGELARDLVERDFVQYGDTQRNNRLAQKLENMRIRVLKFSQKTDPKSLEENILHHSLYNRSKQLL